MAIVAGLDDAHIIPTQLVEVINEDYNDFVSLSTKLVNIDGSVLRMQKPLLELKVCRGTRAVDVMPSSSQCRSVLERCRLPFVGSWTR